VEEHGPVRFLSPAPEWYTAAAARLLKERAEAEWWIFAAGSLIWNPSFDLTERRPAVAQGWRHTFCIGPMMRFRAVHRHRGC
jgi:glutathione-specific gamma-glutamylcyclotransferase